MIVVLDTNVIMDALQERSPFDVEAKEILKHAQDGKFTCLITANAVTDIFYLYSKTHGVKSAKAVLAFMFMNYGVVSVTHDNCKAALSLHIDDFEDALVVICAQRAGADYIITRDDDFLLAASPVKLISPKKFVAMLL